MIKLWECISTDFSCMKCINALLEVPVLWYLAGPLPFVLGWPLPSCGHSWSFGSDTAPRHNDFPLPSSGLTHQKPSAFLPLPGEIQPSSCFCSSPHLHLFLSCVLPPYPHCTPPNAIKSIFFVITAAGLGVSYQRSQVTGNVAAWLLICIPVSAGNFKHFLSPSSFPILPKNLYAVSYIMQKA